MREIPEGFILIKSQDRKDPHDWINSVSVQSLIEKLKKEVGADILYVVYKGGAVDGKRGTWVHPKLYPFFVEWQASPKRELKYRFEDWHRGKLAKELRGKTKVATPAGECDVVAEGYAIEVKDYKYWKSAIGQAQSYAFFLKKKPGIYLINGKPPKECVEVCAYLGIKIFT